MKECSRGLEAWDFIRRMHTSLVSSISPNIKTRVPSQPSRVRTMKEKQGIHHFRSVENASGCINPLKCPGISMDISWCKVDRLLYTQTPLGFATQKKSAVHQSMLLMRHSEGLCLSRSKVALDLIVHIIWDPVQDTSGLIIMFVDAHVASIAIIPYTRVLSSPRRDLYVAV